jgi:hypothetical protein
VESASHIRSSPQASINGIQLDENLTFTVANEEEEEAAAAAAAHALYTPLFHLRIRSSTHHMHTRK